MPRYTFRYLLMAIIVASSCWVRETFAVALFRILNDPDAAPAPPFSLRGVSRGIASPAFRDDQILAIDGRPYSSERQFEEAIYKRRPGDSIVFTLSEPTGRAFEKTIPIPSERGNFSSASQWALAILMEFPVPLVCIFLGAFAVAVRPGDINAWLLLLLLLSFCEIASRDYGPQSSFAFFWNSALGGLWPVFMMLFGIYFPERSPFEKKRPWLKYLFLIPFAAVPLMFAGILLLWVYNINAAAAFRPLFVRLSFLESVLGMLAVGTYFANLGMKADTASPDSRRRLRILMWGSSISLTPILLLVIYSVVHGKGVALEGIPWPISVFALLFLALFPFALAYAIIVERAMDLRFVVRRSIQYGLARGGFQAGRVLLVLIAVYLIRLVTMRGNDAWTPLEFAGVGLGLIALRRSSADRASQWLDRRFFREAYDAELVLAGLAQEAEGFVEIGPLLENIASRVAETLHVPDIVILLRERDFFVPRYSTRPGEPMNISVSGGIAANLRKRNEALAIYFDKPPLWIRTLSVEELQTLDVMRTQLLLPIAARGELTGIVSLGPKLSEAPYSVTDIRLLQTIASQMSLAIENSRLAASLAAAAAERERANRELEIAREVQERLFPQNAPAVPGLDCAGYCRPARAVGGDYYDFLALEGGGLGIAIGDVSGKGIAAALLMASLQASLRGQVAAGVHDLSLLMRNVNTLVYEASTSNRYATFFYGEYDPATRLFRFVNAGHNAPVVLRGDEVLRLEAGGPVVGLLPFAQFAQNEFRMQPADILIAFTDGISEAMNDREEEWEEERFIAEARTCRDLGAREMIRAIFQAADRFTGAARQYDDMTLVIVKL
jgi:sigma-B regulation protein RsbU (phosphoserine phosphatase)